MIASRVLPILAILAVSACGGDDDSAPANGGGMSHTAGAANTGGHAGGANPGGVSPGGSAGMVNSGGTAGASTGGNATTGGVGPTGGAGGAGGTAQTCINCGIANCAASALACYAGPECQAILTCAASAGCQDLACIDACAAQHPSGQTALTPVVTCMRTSCATDCGLA